MGRQITQKIEFAIETRGKNARIGRSVWMHPKIQYKGAGIKWLDDARIARKGGAE